MSGKKEKQERKEQELMSELKLLIDNDFVVLKEGIPQTTYKLQSRVEEITGRELENIDTEEIDGIMATIVEELKAYEEMK